jgi:hypothetical protein
LRTTTIGARLTSGEGGFRLYSKAGIMKGNTLDMAYTVSIYAKTDYMRRESVVIKGMAIDCNGYTYCPLERDEIEQQLIKALDLGEFDEDVHLLMEWTTYIMKDISTLNALSVKFQDERVFRIWLRKRKIKILKETSII